MAAVVQAPVQAAMNEIPKWRACLAKQEKIEVREKANKLEAITAAFGAEIEMANKYKIYADGGQQELFYAVERTDCCKRQVKQCLPDCAPWQVDVLYTQDGSQENAFRMERDFTFTCCCLNRPVVNITDTITSEKLGSIRDPFACCDLTFSVRDGVGQEVMQARGGCCQWGLCCPLPCGPCSKVDFSILDSKDQNIGHIEKKVPSCLKFCFASDVDNYKVDFKGVEPPQHKALLTALTIFIDFRYFNDNRNDN